MLCILRVEGLKALFRPITVFLPEIVLICENILMAEGFEQAKELAVKVTRMLASALAVPLFQLDLGACCSSMLCMHSQKIYCRSSYTMTGVSVR
jgi:hypothetical protein